jgi:DNA-binding GntR family transcriptional regulator
MSPPGTFERVYAALKDKLRRGAFRPGERLEPAALSEELFASVTPIRDALHRLTGERLVEAPRQEGFRVPLLTEPMLRHLYAWHRDLVLLAVLNRARVEQPISALQAELTLDCGSHEQLNSLFGDLARASGNPELVHALEALMERLEPVQRLEALFLDAVEDETAEILTALRHGDRPRLRRSLVRYHRRRQRIVPDLLERLYTEAGGTSP